MSGPIASLVVRISGQLDDLKKDVAQTTTMLDRFGAQFNDISKSVQTAVGALTITAGAKAFTDFLADSVKSFASAESAQRKLTTAIQAQGGAVGDAIRQYNDLATQFQRTTAFSDDLITEMQALLVQVGQVTPDQMGKALQASTDLASGLGLDLRSATLLVAKAFAGGGDELGRLKAILGDAVPVGASMAQVLEAIEKKFGGQAQAEAETYAGKIKQIANAWDNVKEAVGKSIVQDPAIVALMRHIADGANSADDAATAAHGSFLKFLSLGTGPGAGAISSLIDGLEQIADHLNNVADAANVAKRGLPSLFKEPTLQMPSFKDALEEADRLYKENVKAQKEAKAAAEEHARAIAQLADSLTHADLTKKAKDLGEALTLIQRQGKDTPDVLRAVATEAGDLFLKGASLTPTLFDLAKGFGAFNPKVIDGADAFTRYGDAVDLTTPKIQELWKATEELTKKTITGAEGLNNIGFRVSDGFNEGAKRIIDDLKQAQRELDNFVGSLARLASLSSGSFGHVVGDVADIVVAFRDAQKAVEAFGDAETKAGKAAALISGATAVFGVTGSGSRAKRVIGGAAAGAEIGSLFGPWGTAIGAIGGGLTGALRGLFSTAGRDAVKAFAESFGGFDELHRQLNDLGSQGEQFWIKLTQGVGRNSPDQARAAIDDVTKALADHKRKLDDAAQAAKDAGTAESDAMKQAQAAVSDLDNQIKGLQASIANEAPEEEMGVIEKNTRAQIAALEEQRKAAQKTIDDLTAASTDAANKAVDELNEREVRIPVHFDFDDITLPDGGRISFGSVPKLAEGGIVRRPTLALIGENGPEAVVPLGGNGLGVGGGSGVMVVNHNHFHDPVFANDHTSLARFEAKINQATINAIARRGIRIRTA